RAVVVVGGRALEVVSAQVEEAMVGLAAQVDRRNDVLKVIVAEVDALQPVVVGEELVRQPGCVPAELPILVQEKVALGFDRAAQSLVSGAIGIRGKQIGFLLVDSGRANAVLAVRQSLPPVDLAEESLFRQVRRNKRQIITW